MTDLTIETPDPTARDYLEEMQDWLWPKGARAPSGTIRQGRWVKGSWFKFSPSGSATKPRQACTMGAMLVVSNLLSPAPDITVDYRDLDEEENVDSIIEELAGRSPGLERAIRLIGEAIAEDFPKWCKEDASYEEYFTGPQLSRVIQAIVEFNDSTGRCTGDILQVLQTATKKAIDEEVN